MAAKVAFKGAPLTLVGRPLKLNLPAPHFKVTSMDLKEAGLADFKGKIKILTSFPSLDTPVCDLQVKEFNKRASGFAADVVVIGISKDLPFAQKRFCDSFGIKEARLFSDYKSGSFGINYGLLIKELNLLARSVIIVDKEDILRYAQIVAELTSPPDYKEALRALEEAIHSAAPPVQRGLPGRCQACEGGIPALSKEEADALVAKSRGWELVEGRKIVKEFKFRDFSEAKYFLDLVSLIAEEEGHHPVMTLIYNKLKITLTTHAAKGLSQNDFIMAGIIDELLPLKEGRRN